MSGAKKLLLVFLAMVLTLSFISVSVSFAEEEDVPEANMNVGFSSQYIWRGLELSRDSLVLFPSLAMSYKGIDTNLWGAFDTDHYAYDEGRSTNAPGDDSDALIETDITLSYSNSLGDEDFLSYTLGWIYYDVDSTNAAGASNQEIFLSLGLDTTLSPEISAYQEVELNNNSLYLTLGLSHSFEIDDDHNLGVGAWAGFWNMPKGTGVPGAGARRYEQMHDGNIWVALDITVNDYVTITPNANYTWAISRTAKDFLKAASFNGKNHEWFYGGVSLDISL